MNTYRKCKVVFLGVMMMILGTVFTGCGNKTTDQEISLVFIGGPHGNMPVFSSVCEPIRENLYEAAYTYGTVTMLDCSGSPKVFFQTSIPEPEVSGISQSKQKSIAEGYTAQLQAAYQDVEPIAPEVNTLKAISIASRTLERAKGTKVLLVVDNGLQTTGYVNFVNGLLNAAPEDIVTALEQVQALPDLSGVSVVWVGLGDTIAPQKELSERQKTNLKAIWENILYASGATEVTFDGAHSTGEAYENAPTVTVIPVEETVINVSKRVKEELELIDIETPAPIETIILDSTRLEFVGDEAIFINEEQARNVLTDIANELKAHPENKVYVIGTTAGSTTNDFTQTLSEARANTVRESLIQMGVPESQLMARGLGSSDPWHEYDLDDSGRMIEDIAKHNRKTIIMDENSPEALLLP